MPPPTASLQLLHTYELGPDVLKAARALLWQVFDDIEESDWEHCLGGIHALAWEDDRLIGHAAVVQRRLIMGERTLRAGYVEGVGVLEERQRQGVATLLMDALERVIRGAYDLGALGASEAGVPFYTSRGWRQWQGRTFALTPEGAVRTESEDADVHVLEGEVPLDLAADLTCDWREGWVW